MEINGFLTVENKRWDLELNLSNIFSDNLGDFSPVFSSFLEIIGLPNFEPSVSPERNIKLLLYLAYFQLRR